MPPERKGLTVLVTDAFTLKLINSVVGMAKTLENGFIGSCSTVMSVVHDAMEIPLREWIIKFKNLMLLFFAALCSH